MELPITCCAWERNGPDRSLELPPCAQIRFEVRDERERPDVYADCHRCRPKG